MPPAYCDAILNGLGAAGGAGDFCTGGALTSKPPQLEVQVSMPAGPAAHPEIAARPSTTPPPPPLPPPPRVRLNSFPPSSHTQGVGRLELPLSAAQAEALGAVATQAPCGKGTATLLDLSVRRSLQLEPAQLAIANGAEWGGKLARSVKLAAQGLGLPAADVQVRL